MDPTSTPVHDLGLTLSPGSQPSQLDPSYPPKEDDLDSLFDAEDDFNPFNDCEKLVLESCSNRSTNVHLGDLTKKRTNEEAFGIEHDTSSHKRCNLGVQTVSTSEDNTANPSPIQPFIQTEPQGNGHLQPAPSHPSEEDDLASLFDANDDFDPFNDSAKLVIEPPANQPLQTDLSHANKKRTNGEAFGIEHDVSSHKQRNLDRQDVPTPKDNTIKSSSTQPSVQTQPLENTPIETATSLSTQQNSFSSLFQLGDDFDPFTDFGKLFSQLPSDQHTSDQPVPSQPTLNQPASSQPASGQPIRTDLTSGTKKGQVGVSHSSSIHSRFGLGEGSLDRLSAFEALCHGQSSTGHISPYAPIENLSSAPHPSSAAGSQKNSIEELRQRLQSSRRRLDTVTLERNQYRDALGKYEQVNPQTGLCKVQELEAELQRMRRTAANHRSRMDKVKAEAEKWRQQYIDLAHTHNSLVADYQGLQSMIARPGSTVSATQAPMAPNRNRPQGPVPSATGTSQSPFSPLSITSPSPHPQHGIESDFFSCLSPFEDREASRRPSLAGHPSPDLLTPPYALSTHRGQGPSTSLEQTPSLLSNTTCTAPAMTPAFPPIAARHAAPASTTAAAVETVVGPNQRRPVAAPTVPPKDIPVIDLTEDQDTDVSPQGSTSLPPAPLTQDPSPLTVFYRSVRAKRFDWLHQSNRRVDDNAVAGQLCTSLNSRWRRDELGERHARTNVSECYRLVQAQKVDTIPLMTILSSVSFSNSGGCSLYSSTRAGPWVDRWHLLPVTMLL